MTKQIKYYFLCLWLLMSVGLHAQQFKNTYHPASLSGSSPASVNSSYSNPLLGPRNVQPVSMPTRRDNSPSVQYVGVTIKRDYKNSTKGSTISGGGMAGGGMTGGGLAGSGINTTRGGNIKTISSISSYQNIGSLNAPGGGSLLGAGPPPPPPPTPDPSTDDPTHQLPIGDAVWFMLVLACGYVGWIMRKRIQAAR